MNTIPDQQRDAKRMQRYPEGDPRNRRHWKPWYKRYWIIRGHRQEDFMARWIVITGTALALIPVVFVLANSQVDKTIYLPFIISGSGDVTTEVLSRINDARKTAGCPPLEPNPQLQQAAGDWSQHMANDDVFLHRDLAQLRSVYGYQGVLAGENIAAGYQTPAEVVTNWLQSPDHRANILNCSFTESGIGHTTLSPDGGRLHYGVYWTQNFGSEQAQLTTVDGTGGQEWSAPEGLIDPNAPAPQP